jgi:hypothetical protein
MMQNPDTTDLVRAKNFPNRAIAEIGKQMLRENGIESILQSSDLAGTGTPPGGCDLYVRAKDAARARELLTAILDNI